LLIDAISSRSLIATVKAHLLEVHSRKTSALEDYARDQCRFATALSRDPRLVGAAERLARLARDSGPGSGAYAREVMAARPALLVLCETAGFPDLMLFDPSGRALWHLDDRPDPGPELQGGPLADTPLADTFRNAATLLMPSLSTFAEYPGLDEPRAYVGIPLFGASGAVVGIGTLHLDGARLNRVLRDTTGLERLPTGWRTEKGDRHPATKAFCEIQGPGRAGSQSPFSFAVRNARDNRSNPPHKEGGDHMYSSPLVGED
jgi:hypothetical protein